MVAPFEEGEIARRLAIGDRAGARAAAQRLLDAAQASGPVRLDGAALADPRKLSGMRVELTGRFQDRYTIFIDNRSYRGRAGFHVLTPFNSDSLDRPVLVLRGWVPQDPAQRSRLPALPEGEGLQRIVARVQTDLEQALQVAEKIRAAVAGAGHAVVGQITVSIGAGLCPPDVPMTKAQLIEAADQQLYASKRAGRNRVTRAA